MDEQLDPATKRIIGCAITLHRFLGPGLLERVYQTGLAVELGFAKIPFERERRIDVTYRGIRLGEFRPDFIVQNQIVVEVKSASSHDRVFDAQVLTYLRLNRAANRLTSELRHAGVEGWHQAICALNRRTCMRLS